MAYGDLLEDLTRRTVSDKMLRDKAFNIAKNPKYDRYQRDLASMVYKFFDKKISATRAQSETQATENKFAGSCIKHENISNNELAEELHKPIIRKFKKTKVHLPFIDNIWGADLANMQLISKFNERNLFFIMCY